MKKERNKKIKANTFIEGTIITSILLIVIKVLGALYVIPFYQIIGPEGGTLYSYAYNIYNLFLNISTAGIPIAISMIISEYIALNMYDAKERAYKQGKKLISVLAIVSFILVFFGSDYLAKFILSDVVGGHSIKEVSSVIKAISPCLLIIPFLSVLRGYMQGHKFVVPTSVAQVIEQIVRIIIVLIGSFVSIKLLKMNITNGVCIALSGTFFGGLVAYLYLIKKVKDNKTQFPTQENKDQTSNKTIMKKIITYCLPIVLISITDNIYTLVDIKLIIKGLNMIGFTAMESEIVSGIVSTWAPKICTIIIAISMALTTNIIPHVTSNFIKKDMKAVNYRVNQALSTMLIITIPMSLLLILLSKEAYYIFYGASNYGYMILKFSSISHIFLGIWSVLSTTLQSMKKFKQIYIYSITGLILNALLDIPLILLFNIIGIAPYVATVVATCIGYLTSIILSLRYLNKTMKMNYQNTLNLLKKLVFPCILILIPVLISKYYINFEYTFITSMISLIIHGIYGMSIYLLITYKNGSLNSILGDEFINKILVKLHLKRN
ncbi:MAG: polysaccharide biosynthesis protein [bacterium]|nr:polysaccharide biosynthesis protein [bacterium]